MPRHRFSSLLFCGNGSSVRGRGRSGSGLISPHEISYPRMLIRDVDSTDLLSLKVRLTFFVASTNI